MKTKHSKVILAIVFFTTLLIAACQKDIVSDAAGDTQATQKLVVYLNDDPVNYFKTLVDIKFVEVKVDTSKREYDDKHYDSDDDGDDDNRVNDDYGKWDTLKIQPGIYDLLKLRNGVDTLLASGNIVAGRIGKIRITLGSNNTLWTDSTHSYALNICEGKPYVYIKISDDSIDTLSNGTKKIKLDFDVSKSIKQKNGAYCLKPNLKAYCDKNTGKVEGRVLPKKAMAKITMYNATDTASAFPENEGEFKITGLKEGTYNILYDGTIPYVDTLIKNIKITKGLELKLPTITLHL
jgi:Domain of unknown function (DUF4382)